MLTALLGVGVGFMWAAHVVLCYEAAAALGEDLADVCGW